MHFGNKNLNFDYSLNDLVLESVDIECDLGIVLSKDLEISRQCAQAYVMENRMLGVIKRTTALKNSDILLKLHQTLVRPHLEYCTAAWSLHCVKDKELIEKIQHHFFKNGTRIKKQAILHKDIKKNIISPQLILFKLYTGCQSNGALISKLLLLLIN